MSPPPTACPLTSGSPRRTTAVTAPARGCSVNSRPAREALTAPIPMLKASRAPRPQSSTAAAATSWWGSAVVIRLPPVHHEPRTNGETASYDPDPITTWEVAPLTGLTSA